MIGSLSHGAAAPSTLQLAAELVGLVVIHYPPNRPTCTVITRHFANGTHARCRLCPRELCGASERGVCTVVVGSVVEPRLAGAYRIDAGA
jgi:hypothetical protein